MDVPTSSSTSLTIDLDTSNGEITRTAGHIDLCFEAYFHASGDFAFGSRLAISRSQLQIDRGDLEAGPADVLELTWCVRIGHALVERSWSPAFRLSVWG